MKFHALADRGTWRRYVYCPNECEAAYRDGSEHEALAERKGIVMKREALHKAALQWELSHPGRTSRTARQFLAGMGL